ncbi:MAG: glycoside hydrolase family 2, partial [Clostridiaceae bacterium]|nr:glycoside hydrolase family 2 [Clostridiaceae bacterium]
LLRCTSRNGGPGTRLLSQLEWTVTGLGTAYKDPYGFVSAGLYTRSWGEVSNGNERGVATARGAETRVCVEGIDFGPFGSDTITMPLFALTSEPYAMQIWEGMPGDDGAQMLADVVYQKPSRWNVYQEETFRLSRRLRGITSICFVLHDKVHIKGFTFTRPDRAFSDNPAAEADHLYGDTFTVVDGKVEEIGNNVSLEFGGMAFGPEGATGILIRGHSPIDRNTLHLRFSGPEGDEARSVEFTRSDAYEERVFSIERVTGDRTVTFMFLPGSRFDFDSFRFLR